MSSLYFNATERGCVSKKKINKHNTSTDQEQEVPGFPACFSSEYIYLLPTDLGHPQQHPQL